MPPSTNVLGSYFPSWMLCVLGGIVAMVVVRQLLVALRIDRAIPAPVLVYLALLVLFSFAGWLTWLD
jgi:hypothetical protein